MLLGRVIPAWKGRPIASLTRRDVRALLESIVDTGRLTDGEQVLVVDQRDDVMGDQRGYPHRCQSVLRNGWPETLRSSSCASAPSTTANQRRSGGAAEQVGYGRRWPTAQLPIATGAAADRGRRTDVVGTRSRSGDMDAAREPVEERARDRDSAQRLGARHLARDAEVRGLRRRRHGQRLDANQWLLRRQGRHRPEADRGLRGLAFFMICEGHLRPGSPRSASSRT